ncbi:zinc finger protein CO3 [Musa acuminata AAA Group]|uniref:zinc finger protein CO3 n=1 Tax=Musa acuminata AAA Group TaxID=214697 RepID=UPI0031D2630C
MFHSFSSSNGDGSLHHQVSTSSVPHGLLPLPSSSPPDSSSFPTGCYLHRSSSTHSLAFHHHLLKSIDAPQPAYSSSPSFSSCPVRRVVSTGDLQRMHGVRETPRVRRYSAEERKERIERYRSKRNQRNFRKKITYACRKTLADSRPRVRGRFVRNGETETEVETETEAAAGNSLECFRYGNDEQNQSRSRMGGGTGGEWSSQLQTALETDEEHEDYYDEELLSIFADVFSMDILS